MNFGHMPLLSMLRTFEDAGVRPSIRSGVREECRCHDCETRKTTGTEKWTFQLCVEDSDEKPVCVPEDGDVYSPERLVCS